MTLIDARLRKKRILIFLLFILALSVFLAPCIGSVIYSPYFVVKSILNPSGLEGLIVANLRVPRVLMGLIVGSALAVAGVVMQTIFRNPMAEPYVLGISAGAGLGAVLGFVLSFSVYAIPVSAFTTSIATVVVVYNLAKVRGYITTESLLLAGIAVNFFLYALEWVLLIKTNAHMILSWLVGNLGNTSWIQVYLSIPAVVLSCSILLFANKMNAMLFGDEQAYYLGVDVQRLRRILIVLATFATSITVSFVGLIAFVGLMIPHMARMLVGDDNRFLIPSSALMGGIFLIWADAVARILSIPVGIITMLCGCPFFIYMLRCRYYKSV
jgi:iron complex transport system permease protein